jgi:hypothetical protein
VTAQASTDAAKVSWDGFDQLQTLDFQATGLQLTRQSLEDNPMDLLPKSMAVSHKVPQPSPSPERSFRSDIPSAAPTVSSQILANLENGTSLAKKVDSKDVKLGFLKCKGACNQLLDQLKTTEAESGDKKKYKKAIADMHSTIGLLNKAEKKNDKKFNKEVTFKLVAKAATMAKKHSSLIEF